MRDHPLTVYTPESPLRQPAKFVRDMIADLLASRELAWRLFLRDLSAQYRNSVLGYVWVFLPPLVASLPFVYLNSTGVVRMGETPIPYAAYAMVGTIIWCGLSTPCAPPGIRSGERLPQISRTGSTRASEMGSSRFCGRIISAGS